MSSMRIDVSTNPIAVRMRQGSRGPSESDAQRIGIGVGVVGGVVSLISIVAVDNRILSEVVPMALLVVGLLAAMLSLPFYAIVSAGMMSRYARDEEMALLRLSGLTPEMIVRGYGAGILHRMRLPRMIIGWFLMAGSAVVAYGIGLAGMGRLCGDCEGALAALGAVVAGSIPAATIFGLGIFFYFYATSALVQAGIWASLRWPEPSGMAAGVLGLITAMVIAAHAVLGLVLGGPMAMFGCGGSILCFSGVFSMMGAFWIDEVASSAAIKILREKGGKLPPEGEAL